MADLDLLVQNVFSAEFLPDEPGARYRAETRVTQRMVAEGAFEVIMGRYDGSEALREEFDDALGRGALLVFPLVEVAPTGNHYPDGILRLLMGKYDENGALGMGGLVTTIGRRINGSSAWLIPSPDVPGNLAWAANSYVPLIGPAAA